MKKVLIVDDSVVVRKLLNDILSAHPEIEVVGSAATGEAALEKIASMAPDIITLDIEMPGMDGLQTLTEIRKRHPKLPVIMFSALTERGAQATLYALSLGANDYVTKPTGGKNAEEARKQIENDLIQKLLGIGSKPAARSAPVPAPATDAPRRVPSDIRAIAIGVSTGGPNALTKLISMLPGDINVPIFITQHMPPIFTRALAEQLSTRSKLPVCEAQPGDIVKAGHVYIAPGGYHMVLSARQGVVTIETNEDPPEHSCRPAVDVMMRSLIPVYGGHMIGVILTGMGHDGREGCRLIRNAGGWIIAQDEATCVVWGMPGSVVEAKLADKVLPIEAIAPELAELLSSKKRETQHAA